MRALLVIVDGTCLTPFHSPSSPAKTNSKVQSSPQNGTDPVGKTAEKPVR